MAIVVNSPSTSTVDNTNTVTRAQGSSAGDWVFVFVYIEKTATSTPPTMTSVASTGPVGGTLTWAKRATVSGVVGSAGNPAFGNGAHTLEIWYAHTPTPMNSSNDSVVITAAQSVEHLVYAITPISGLDPTNPFDGNGSHPASASETVGTADVTTQVTGIDTQRRNTVVFGVWGSTCVTANSAGTGYTSNANVVTATQNNWGRLLVEYKINSSIQTGITVPTNNTSRGWIMLVDVFTSDNTPPRRHVKTNLR